ncbi:hypothetical protein BRD19_03775 [Halobacteriales archaeon SW_7_65_23]|nr:MAG: hypothetical protein BRD19_03775 [Halobacteriales archaeon SW_7_65_23]
MERGIRVLHVDDDPDFGKLTTTVLEREDEQVTVETATNASDGLDMLGDERYDAVVSDYDIPGANGIEFLEQVRAVYPDLPFVLFTGKGSETVASEAISAGVTDYLQKRGGTEQYELLLNRIRNAVEGYRTEQALEQQLDLLTEAEEVANIGVWEYNVREDTSYVTDEVLRIHGLDPGADLSPEKFQEYYHPDDQPTIRAAFERAIEAQEPYDLELRLIDDDGERRWIRSRGSPETVDGEVVSVRGSIQDITARKQRQTVLHALHRVAPAIQAEDSVEGICGQTVEAATEILNMDLCTVVIREGEWLVPRATSSEMLPDGSRPMRIELGLAGKTYQTRESYIVDDAAADEDTDPAKEHYRSGISVPIGDHGVFQAVRTERAAFDDDDVEFAELLLSHTRSALDRIERERELKRKNDRLEEFASIVGHDLRNPLNVAQGRLEMALAIDDTNDRREHLEAVERSHDRMETLIEELLGLARAGETIGGVEPVELAAVARRAWETVDTGDATLSVTTTATISADPDRLQQLFENLFRNAVEHGSTSRQPPADDPGAGGSDVTVTVGDLDEGFYAADDGPGIPAEEREQVFDSGYTTSEDGTGFGLGIVQNVVEAHGWEIQVTESNAGGARFEITGVSAVAELE